MAHKRPRRDRGAVPPAESHALGQDVRMYLNDGHFEGADVLVSMIKGTLGTKVKVKATRPPGASKGDSAAFLAGIRALVKAEGLVLEHRYDEHHIWLWCREPDFDDVPDALLATLGTLLRH